MLNTSERISEEEKERAKAQERAETDSGITFLGDKTVEFYHQAKKESTRL